MPVNKSEAPEGSFARGFVRRFISTTIATALFVAGVALATGGMAGFLFGIPRSAQEPQGSAGLPLEQASEYKVNTNLEQISDWLTKIIVGIGLTQLGTVPPSFMAAALLYFGIVGGRPPGLCGRP